jgi:peptide/nickel transport system substrate-binding protein
MTGKAGVIWISTLLLGCRGTSPLKRESYELPLEPQRVEVTGRYGSIFVTAIHQEPKTFNPLAYFDLYSAMAQRFLFGTLLEYDFLRQDRTPGLAKEWHVEEDGKTYTVVLRKGVRWSDGEPFTADDVVFTFDALLSLDPETGRPRFPNILADHFGYGNEKLRYWKKDDTTVQFFTPQVSAAFLHYLTEVPIIPRHVLHSSFEDGSLQRRWSLQTAVRNPREIVGLGPFRIHTYRPGERFVLVPNPHYWKVEREGRRLPYIDYFVTSFVPNVVTQTILFATGQTDAAQISPTDLAWIQDRQKKNHFTLHFRGPDNSFWGFWFNQNTGCGKGGSYVKSHKLKWFRDVRFRRAVAHAIHREGLIQAYYMGLGEAVHSFLPRSDPWYYSGVKTYPYDLPKARQLLTEAGFRWDADGTLRDADGNEVQVEVSWATAGSDVFITMFQEDMSQLGIRVKVRTLDFNALCESVRQTYAYEATSMKFTSPRDPSDAASFLKSEGCLHGWFPQQPVPSTEWEREIDILFEKQERTLDRSERKRWVDRIQEIFSENVPVIGLVAPHHYTGIKDKWKNIKIPPRGSVVWNVEELWSEER